MQDHINHDQEQDLLRSICSLLLGVIKTMAEPSALHPE
jgi:hypothetical protein